MNTSTTTVQIPFTNTHVTVLHDSILKEITLGMMQVDPATLAPATTKEFFTVHYSDLTGDLKDLTAWMWECISGTVKSVPGACKYVVEWFSELLTEAKDLVAGNTAIEDIKASIDKAMSKEEVTTEEVSATVEVAPVAPLATPASPVA